MLYLTTRNVSGKDVDANSAYPFVYRTCLQLEVPQSPVRCKLRIMLMSTATCMFIRAFLRAGVLWLSVPGDVCGHVPRFQVTVLPPPNLSQPTWQTKKQLESIQQKSRESPDTGKNRTRSLWQTPTGSQCFSIKLRCQRWMCAENTSGDLPSGTYPSFQLHCSFKNTMIKSGVIMQSFRARAALRPVYRISSRYVLFLFKNGGSNTLRSIGLTSQQPSQAGDSEAVLFRPSPRE